MAEMSALLDGHRTGGAKEHPLTSWGFTFCPRQAVTHVGGRFLGYNPAISRKSRKKIAKRGKEGRKTHRSR
ncbi:hypothetical protein [Pasteuria penetrans]|uniref:hypothetical protein n=1 Tax=Pasteuria penetrans TaxID=86005 RepID=UPI0011EDE430|nr:hypothetical protein [Pasteuria penetrans]